MNLSDGHDGCHPAWARYTCSNPCIRKMSSMMHEFLFIFNSVHILLLPPQKYKRSLTEIILGHILELVLNCMPIDCTYYYVYPVLSKGKPPCSNLCVSIFSPWSTALSTYNGGMSSRYWRRWICWLPSWKDTA